ncbi:MULTISPECIES: MerR family transcriptional regulator [unclassified Streptomyces]|uniref:MerR family transcriptional regulator n=1 Tax=unclassified Streptomyces TaxID=2593676 RepID=UPI003824A53B
MQSNTIGRAARLLGVSAGSARRRADAGRVATHRDESGRRVIDGKPLAAFSPEITRSGDGVSRTPVRDASPGNVTAVGPGDLAAQATAQAGPHRLVPLLTREAVVEPGPEVAIRATARVKSTGAHIDRT